MGSRINVAAAAFGWLPAELAVRGCAMGKYIVGIDIGGTKCAVILGSAVPEKEEECEILERMSFETEAEQGPDHVIRKLIFAIHHLIAKNNLKNEQISAIGISCGGPLDHIKGVINNPPNLYGWDHVPIIRIMEEEFQIPAYIQNDANACALAEWKFGAGRGCRNMIFLTCGTGMGAGLILNGELYTGMNNMAGEIGHVRMADNGPVGFGKAGSFEGFCSGGGITQIARTKVLEQIQMGEKPGLCPDLAHMDSLTAKSVAQAAKEGDPLAIDIYSISGYYMGKGISVLIDILNPEMIVIGSVYERSSELFWPSMNEVIEREALEISRKGCRIVSAGLGNRIGDYAALSVAIQGGIHDQNKRDI